MQSRGGGEKRAARLQRAKNWYNCPAGLRENMLRLWHIIEPEY